MKNVRENIGRQNLKILLLPFYFLLFTCLSFAQTLAPNAPGKDAQWASAGKQGVGTSANLESKVWFTLQGGALTEVYYPDVTVANVHLLQFIVVNPKTKKVETERDDTNHKVESLATSVSKDISWIPNLTINKSFYSPSSMAFEQTNSSKTGDWWIVKTYVTDPKTNSVLISVSFRTENPDLELYVYYDPSLGNSGMHDTGWTKGRYLVSEDSKIALALTCGGCKFSDVANGFLGVNDGLTQLLENGKIAQPFDHTERGNLVQVAKVTHVGSGKSKMIFGLSFGNNPQTAMTTAYNTLTKGFDANYREYQKGWLEYLSDLPKVEPKYQAQFNMAAMQLKVHEDKTVRENRMLLGASLGSITSVHIALKHSDKFAKIGGQSVSWWVDNERVVKELEKSDGKTSFKFYIDDGTLEGVEDSRKAVEILKKKGFSVVYKESEAGHNWTAWRDRLADAFIALMSEQPV